jgi:hypothetical protein
LKKFFFEGLIQSWAQFNFMIIFMVIFIYALKYIIDFQLYFNNIFKTLSRTLLILHKQYNNVTKVRKKCDHLIIRIQKHQHYVQRII